MPEKGSSSLPRALREQYEKGLAALQRQNFDYAIAILAEVLQREPGFYSGREALRAPHRRRSPAKITIFIREKRSRNNSS